MAVYEPGRIGLLLIDTVNEIFSEGGKGYPNFKDEFERIGTRENIARLLAYARERDIPSSSRPCPTPRRTTRRGSICRESIAKCTTTECSRLGAGAPTSTLTSARVW
jgi:hypothetical protein